MKKTLVKKLNDRALEVEWMYSQKDREYNHNNESFKLHKIKPLSESVAVAIYKKIPTKKIAIACFYWVNGSGGRGEYFFPTYDHCVGFERIKNILYDTEEYNFDKN